MRCVKMYGYSQNPMTMNPMYQNTFQNPYQNRLEALQQNQNPRYEITRVNGRNGAEAFQMPPNSSILLLDESQPIVWLKQTDGAGYPTTTPYSIAPYQAKPEPDFNSLDERLRKVEMILSGEPNSSTAKSADAESAK